MLSAITLKVSLRMPTAQKKPRSRGARWGDLQRVSGCFLAQLNRLQEFPVLLRIGDNLPLRQAREPLVVWDGPAPAARTHVASMAQIQRMFFRCLLLPASAVADAEDSDVAPGQQLKRIVNLVHAVKLRRPLGSKALEPCRIHEV